jgi:uncharacterized protein
MPIIKSDEIRELLKDVKNIAVVGYSHKPDRPSYGVFHALRGFGYNVYAVNPELTHYSTEETPIYESLADVPAPIDIVDVFRRSEHVPPVVEDAIKVGAKAVWLQLGIVNDQAMARAEEAGLKAVQNRCLKVEHIRLMEG